MSKLQQLKETTSLHDLAILLGYQPKALSYILYILPDTKKYRIFQIPKKYGGYREIKAPNDKLKKLQRRLADLLNICFEEIHKERKQLSHGFRKKLSIKTNAKKHRNKHYVFNIDLSDFFPSINFGRVRGFLIKDNDFKLSPQVATVIAQIACHDNELPQGSPCSPIISNLIGHLLDIRLVSLAKKTKCTYSRYADDITFSTNKKNFPNRIAFQNDENEWVVGKSLKKEVERVGFKINEDKTSMQYRVKRQVTTGLIVNRKVNVKREYYKITRSMCHELFQHDVFYLNDEFTINNLTESADSEKPCKGSINQLEGILSFIYQIKKESYATQNNDQKTNRTGIKLLYRNFLFYKHFFSLNMPLIVCEGKTDIVYLKCALKSLENEFSTLISQVDGKYQFKIKFLNMSKTFKEVLSLASGTSGLANLMSFYEKSMKKYTGNGKKYPVIIIIDNDSGAKTIKGILNIKDINNFHHYKENLYVIFSTEVENTEIESLFDATILNTKIDEKIFNPKKVDRSPTEYGKHIFAEKVVKLNQQTINFNLFKPIFNKINMVITHYQQNNNIKQSTN